MSACFRELDKQVFVAAARSRPRRHGRGRRRAASPLIVNNRPDGEEPRPARRRRDRRGGRGGRARLSRTSRSAGASAGEQVEAMADGAGRRRGPAARSSAARARARPISGRWRGRAQARVPEALVAARRAPATTGYDPARPIRASCLPLVDILPAEDARRSARSGRRSRRRRSRARPPAPVEKAPDGEGHRPAPAPSVIQSPRLAR